MQAALKARIQTQLGKFRSLFGLRTMHSAKPGFWNSSLSALRGLAHSPDEKNEEGSGACHGPLMEAGLGLVALFNSLGT